MTAAEITTVELTAGPSGPPQHTPSPTLLLVYRGSDQPQTLDPEAYEAAVVDPLTTAFCAVQYHWPAVVEHAGRIIALAPASAGLGDADKPLDAAVIGGLISLVRSLAIELQRHGATANTILFDTAPEEPSTQVMVTAVLAEAAHSITGQEIYAGASLGKLRP